MSPSNLPVLRNQPVVTSVSILLTVLVAVVTIVRRRRSR
jgi:hypothetical protein